MYRVKENGLNMEAKELSVKIENERFDFNEDSLLIAIGNSARQDDGLGWVFLEEIEKTIAFKGNSKACYQLQVEDAEEISRYSKVIFVDACVNPLEKGYSWEKTGIENDFSYTTHALTPGAVLFLCRELYNRSPEAFTLKIQGYQWELKTGLSPNAQQNLVNALEEFRSLVLNITN